MTGIREEWIMKYNHNTMFEDVKNAWNDGFGCLWCKRDTDNPFDGHDGYCPVPVMFALEAENEALKKEVKRGYTYIFPRWIKKFLGVDDE